MTPAPDSSPGEVPRPTQAAFKPASNKEIWGAIAGGFCCLLGVALGVGAWFDPTLLESQNRMAADAAWLLGCLPFIFPIFLPLALYFWWAAWRDWRQTRAFAGDRQTTTGVITHLWVDPPRPPGKRYYVGYQFGQGQSAYQSVQARTYNRLTVGEAVTVEYSAAKPQLSCLNLQKKPSKSRR
jgi:hypothetical protein